MGKDEADPGRGATGGDAAADASASGHQPGSGDVAEASQRLVTAQNTALDALRVREVTRAQLFAGDVRLLVELGELVDGQQRWSELEQFVDLELAGTLVLGRTAATNHFCDAARFALALPVTLALLEAGLLFVHQALMVLRKTHNCPVEVSRLVEARVLPGCAGLCPADLGRRVEAEVLTVEGERQQLDAQERRAAAVRARRTFLRPEDDGMAVVGGYLPAEQARQWALELEILQRQEQVADRAAGAVRTADQRRADVLASLPGIVLAARAAGLVQPTGGAGPVVTGDACRADIQHDAESGAVGGGGGGGGGGVLTPPEVVAGCTRGRAPRILINVHVPMSTVLELSQAPGLMTGYGLVSAEHVRGLLPSADLRAIYVDEGSGRPVSVGAVLCARRDPVTGRLLTEPAAPDRNAPGCHVPGRRASSGPVPDGASAVTSQAIRSAGAPAPAAGLGRSGRAQPAQP